MLPNISETAYSDIGFSDLQGQEFTAMKHATSRLARRAPKFRLATLKT